MSNNEWERATFTLPTAAVAPLKQALRDWVNDFNRDARAAAVTLHRNIGTRSEKKYREALYAHQQASYARPTYGLGSTTSGRDEAVRQAAQTIIANMLDDHVRNGTALHQPTLDEIAREAPKATQKTTVFYIGHEASITFHDDRRTVTWNVPENNHAVEHAHEEPLAQVFFGALDRLTWTRGTGGYGVGNDESSRSTHESGGGSNYTTFTYGPLGEQQSARDMGVTVAKWKAMRKLAAATRATRTSHYGYGYPVGRAL